MPNKYFDKIDKQYKQEMILNPPIHTKLEINNLISKIVDKKVVDFGAGTGRLTVPLLQSGFEVTAVDVSKLSLNKIKLLTDSSKFTISTTITKTKVIVGCDVLHHINIDKYFGRFYKNLETGGQIIFSEPNGWNFFWYLLIFFKLDWREEKGIMKINYFNVINKLKKNKFRDIQIFGVGILPGPFCFNNKTICQINYWLGNLPIIKLFSYRLLISARKD